MVEIIDDYVRKLKSKLKNSSKKMDFLEELNKLALQVICKTAMGYNLNLEEKSASQYRQVFK